MNPPASPLTPPCKPIDCLPFSFSFSRMSTVPFLVSRLISADLSASILSK